MGLLAVAFPLLVIIYMQYHSLVTLERTLPVYRKEVMREFLSNVSDESATYFHDNAERVLSVPATAITGRVGGIIQGSKDKTAIFKATTGVAEFFKQVEFRGARRYFIVVDTEYEDNHTNAILFYNPQRQTLELDSGSPEWRAIQVACAAYIIYIRARAEVGPSSMGVDRDPSNPLIVKPIRDEANKIVAVAGFTVDTEYFQMEYLPAAIKHHLQERFPTDYQDVMVAVNDETGDLVLGDEWIADADAEAVVRLGFIFQRWFLATRMRHMTEAQWARRNFYINLSLWGGASLLLVSGIVLTMRTASRAMKLSQMKSDFVSNVSHELRTPLASIRVFGEFLKLGRVRDQAKMREYGEYIETESRRLTQLINNILDFSRIESGQKSYQFLPTDIREVVADTLKMFEVRLKQSDFVIEFANHDAELPMVSIDADAITQALVNLLDNAVKYSGASQKITVRLDHKNHQVLIAVTDHGIGIPDEDQDKIFERFHRVSTGLVHDVKGSGLGLAIVKHIIEAHGGQVTVESKAGSGSTFTIHLPVNESLSARRDTPSTAIATDGQSLIGPGVKG
jgi:signal transduction histidine kinase